MRRPTIEPHQVVSIRSHRLLGEIRDVLIAGVNAYFDDVAPGLEATRLLPGVTGVYQAIERAGGRHSPVKVREFMEAALEYLYDRSPELRGLKFVLPEPLPEEEAAARLAGTFDPNVVTVLVQVPEVLEFVSLTYTLNSGPP
jgi:hypothetical protein